MSMNQYLKYIVIVLVLIFILWNLFISAIAFSGCPPTYVILKMTYNASKNDPNVVHISQQDIPPHPGIVEAFSKGKYILLPIGTAADFVPGRFFGSKYADTRISVEERKYMEKYYTSVWEYNGSYFKLTTTQC